LTVPGTPHIVAVVPARGGSKRVPRKNLRLLGGLPLVAWSIRHAQALDAVHRCIVSTDDADIARVARDEGAEVHDRSAALASDTANTIDLLQQLQRDFEAAGQPADYFILLQPTCPFRDVDQLAEDLQRLVEARADMLLSVSRVKAGPAWMMTLENEQLQFAFDNDFAALRTQDQPALYRPNGSLYIFSADCLRAAERFPWGERVLSQVLEPPYNLDIDEEIDFQIAETFAHEYLFHR